MAMVAQACMPHAPTNMAHGHVCPGMHAMHSAHQHGAWPMVFQDGECKQQQQLLQLLDHDDITWLMLTGIGHGMPHALQYRE